MISLLKKNKTIVEYYPTNPNTVIIKNQFYPKGLTELDLYDYYIKNKNFILKQVEDRELMFFLGLENGDTVVKRRTPEGKYIILNNGNYKDLITGRTVSIHSTMKQKENFGIVDIDSTDFRKSKLATINVYDYLKSIPEIKNVQIRYTGKDSFHLICTLNKILTINDIRSYFKTILSQRFTKEYEIAYHKKLGSKVNLDLSSNKYRGGFITLGSLSVLGLKCMKLSKGQLKNFNKEQAKIK